MTEFVNKNVAGINHTSNILTEMQREKLVLR
ncbi:hypothetical protein SOV_19500 [Sporomusa ovata DSM 2662]|nr:hypothetical protein SOV_1c12820 [Sporomusa ovata DSM 2662]